MKIQPFCCDITSGTEQEQEEFKRLLMLANPNLFWPSDSNYYGYDKNGLWDYWYSKQSAIKNFTRIISLSEGIKILKQMVGEDQAKNNFNGLLPCPFCGSNDLLLFAQPSKDGSITWSTIMHRSNVPCAVSMIHSDVEQLKKDWNKRHSNS